MLFLAAWLAALAATRLAAPQCNVGGPDDLGCARGFQTRERDGASSFRWTDDSATVLLFGVGYGAPIHAEITLAAPRNPDLLAPHVVIGAGPVGGAIAVLPTPRRYHLLTAPLPPHGDWLELRIRSETWAPGGRRDLGVQVFRARARSLGAAWPGVILPGALWLCGLGAAAFVNSLRRRTAVAVVAIIGGAACWIGMPERVTPLLPGAGLIGLALVAAHRILPASKDTPFPRLLPVIIGINALLDLLVVARIAPGALIPVLLAAQSALTVMAVVRAPDLSLRRLVLIAFCVRLLALGVRLLSGRGATDPDVELFYNYGRATIELGVPIVEYPSGALISWALLALPTSRELFALLLPLFNTACELLVVWGLWRITRPHSNLALFFAVSPLLLPFWHGKYDPLPAALLALGLAAWHAGRGGWAGFALGLGGAVKWVPWLAAPFMGWQLLKNREPRTEEPAAHSRFPLSAVRFTLSVIGGVACASLPFALQDFNTFVSPYLVQGSRPMIGESIWFLVALLFEPALLDSIGSPWSGVESAIISTTMMVAVQLLVLIILAGIQILRPQATARTLALAALAPVSFLLLNRVFSPQYLTIITIGMLIAGGSLPQRGRLLLIALLALMQTANLLIWPHTQGFWPIASLILFATGVGMGGWLAVRVARG
jgi:hypothetical protein